jgi:hypothetical protein
MNEARKKARWRKRRIIYNNDGDDAVCARTGQEFEHDSAEGLTVRTEGELIDDFLNARNTPLIGSQVDSNWYCSCMAGLTFSHQTKLGGFYDQDMPPELIEKYGRDTLQIHTDFSHQHDMEVFWSLRMNDVHDATPPGLRRWNYGLAAFKRDHPEFLMGTPDDSEHAAWTSLDYSFPEVRDHVFSIIEEVAHNYDVDGVEMDFFRHYPYFRPTREMLPVEPQHLEMMTDLMRRVRKLADEVGTQRGRPLLLAARTPFNTADSRFIGVDLGRWLEEDLLDLLIPGGGSESSMSESFAEIVALGHRHDVPVYPCIDWAFWDYWTFLGHSRGRHRTRREWLETLYGGQPERLGKPSYIPVLNEWEGTRAAWRGAAMNLFNAGADGLYIFNPGLGKPEVWREIGDPEIMEGKDKLFGIDVFGGDSSFEHVPEVEIPREDSLGLHFQVGEDPNSNGISELRFRLHLWDVRAGEIQVKLNGATLDDLALGEEQHGSASLWLECQLKPEQVRMGENQVELLLQRRDEAAQTPATVDGVQLSMRY